MAMLLAIDADNSWDAVVSSNRIQMDPGLFTAVAISLFTNAAASVDELAAAGLPADYPNGYWADAYATVEGDTYGSKLWLLDREIVDGPTLARGKRWAEEALAWMPVDRLARTVVVTNFWLSTGHMIFQVVITRPDGTRWESVWDAATGEGAEA